MASQMELHQDWVTQAARQFERPLLAYVRRFVVDEHRGRDIVQDAFLQLLKQPRETIEPRLAEWLYTVCRRRAIDIHRKENRMSGFSETLDPPSLRAEPGAAIEQADTTQAVFAQLAQLPGNQQEAVRLRFQQQFSYREIGSIMGLSESHVGVLLHQALTSLRRTFAEPNLHTTITQPRGATS
ncbi:MAG: RNA polymerase sigma factor [Gemmataceae bacterium]